MPSQKTVFCVVNDFHGFYRRPSMAVDGRRKHRKITVFIDEQYLYIFIDAHRRSSETSQNTVFKDEQYSYFLRRPRRKNRLRKNRGRRNIDGRRKRRKTPSLRMSNIHIFLRRPRRKNRLRKNRRRRDVIDTVENIDDFDRWSSTPSQNNRLYRRPSQKNRLYRRPSLFPTVRGQ